MTREPGGLPGGEPLAYFLTWTTYGTWLPGDERGWVSKPGQFELPNAQLEAVARQSMTEPALTLDDSQRSLVERTITEHCLFRRWHLHAVDCRSNHVHVVVTAPQLHPDNVMEQFKAWCTRRLKQFEQARAPSHLPVRRNWWTQRGSRRWLNDEVNLEAAIKYVKECQGTPIIQNESTCDHTQPYEETQPNPHEPNT